MAELVLVAQVRDAYRKLKSVPCTACRNCMPCPVGIDVPRIFEIYNDAVMYGDTKTACSTYRFENHNIGDCTECGVCENSCGKEIPIIDWLKKALLLFSK
jgi:predicted aldo/keto reductase-like oxidoreductase